MIVNVAAVELEDVDLNLLLVFRRILAERSVSKAADGLGLTQPAVSNALARLRRMLGDELFVRTSSGMEPTPFALQLAEPLAAALGAIHRALNQRASFDPRGSARSFTIGMSDIGEITFLPELMERLRTEAPGVSISTVRNAAVDLKEAMEAGQVDLAIGLLPQLKAGFFQRLLFRQRYVCLFRKGHRLDKGRVALAEFAAAGHLVVVSAGTGHGRVDAMLAARGVERHVRLTVPHFVAVGHILQATDLVATVPERLAQRMAEPFGLAFAAHPAKLPEVAINVLWHAKVHKAPDNQWLRGLIFDAFADDAAESKRRSR